MRDDAADGRRARVSVAVILIAVVLTMALRWPFRSVAFERDEGAYAYVAWRLLEGEVPYRDVFDHKPPGVHLLYALAIATLGRSVEAVRILAAVWTALGTIGLYLLGRRSIGRRGAAIAALAFAAFTWVPGLQGFTANAEVLFVPPLLFGLWRYATRFTGARRRADEVVAGALLGGAALVKPQAATVLLVVLLHAIASGGSGARARYGAAVGVAAGAAIPAVIVAGLFAARGGLQDLIACVLGYNLVYAEGGLSEAPSDWLSFACGRLWEVVRDTLPLVLLAIVGLGRALRERNPAGRFLVACAIGGVAGVALGGWRLFPHYFVQVLPFAALLAGHGGDGLVAAVAARRRHALALAAALVVAAAGVWVARATFVTWLRFPREVVSGYVFKESAFAVSPEVAVAVARRTDEDDRIHVHGAEPQIYFYAGRRAATWLPYRSPVEATRRGRDGPVARLGHRLLGARAERLTPEAERAELAAAAPRAIVIATRPPEASIAEILRDLAPLYATARSWPLERPSGHTIDLLMRREEGDR